MGMEGHAKWKAVLRVWQGVGRARNPWGEGQLGEEWRGGEAWGRAKSDEAHRGEERQPTCRSRAQSVAQPRAAVDQAVR